MGADGPDAVGSLRPELRLILDACRPPSAPLLYRGERLDPSLLARLAAFHRVPALVYAARDRVPLPPDTLEPLRKAALDARHRGLQALAGLKPVLRAFAEAGIPAILLKGIALMDEAYDEPGQRPVSDVDLLVQPERISEALVALRGLGYTTEGKRSAFGLAADREIKLTGAGPFRMALDLHADLNRPTRHHWFPMDALWARSRERTLEGEPARALGFADNLTFLCAHATPHAFAQLIWLCDIARSAERLTPDPAELARAARESRTVCATWAGLALAETVLESAACRDARRGLESAGGLESAPPEWMTPATTLGAERYSTRHSLRFRFGLADTRRDGAAMVWAAAARKAGEAARGLAQRKRAGRLE